MRKFNDVLERVMVILLYAIPALGFLTGFTTKGSGIIEWTAYGVLGLIIGVIINLFAFGIISPLLEIAMNSRAIAKSLESKPSEEKPNVNQEKSNATEHNEVRNWEIHPAEKMVKMFQTGP